MATTAVKSGGAQSEQTKAMKRAAADLIWSASAKVTREERAEVIRRLPPLLKTLREGMAPPACRRQAGRTHPGPQQLAGRRVHRQGGGDSRDRLRELMGRLETLEELLPDRGRRRDRRSMVLDLSGHEAPRIEVVGEGGSMPTPAMLAWARELQVGSWYMLDYRGRNEPVQLGVARPAQAAVAVRLAAGPRHPVPAAPPGGLPAGLLAPAQDESRSPKRHAQPIHSGSTARRRSRDLQRTGIEDRLNQWMSRSSGSTNSSSRISASGSSPRLQKTISTMIFQVFQVERAGLVALARSIIFAHRRRQRRPIEKADEADRGPSPRCSCSCGEYTCRRIGACSPT